MRVERVADAAAVEAGAELFDGPPRPEATALVRALEALARERGCYGMWVGVDIDNEPALATYRRAGAAREEMPFASYSWDFTARGA